MIPKVENQTEEMLNATNLMYNFTRFISESFDEEYLIDEVRQYGQTVLTLPNHRYLSYKRNWIHF